MNLWSVDKILNRMDLMLENAIMGKDIETCFDETKMSAIETKLAKYLAMNQTRKQELQEEKDRMNRLISDISHQTKTPIANLLLYTELLGEEELSDKARSMLDALNGQAQKLSFLIADLVKTSRLERGIIATDAGECEIREIFDRCRDEIAAKAERKQIEVSFEETDCRAWFDLKWTTEAVVNLVDNAIKYTDSGGKVEVSARSYQMFTRIDIRDDGMGIEESEIPKIFGRFYRGTDVRGEEGVGLGLYLAREIIRNQGGYIKVSSKPWEGSCFSVFLPNLSKL